MKKIVYFSCTLIILIFCSCKAKYTHNKLILDAEEMLASKPDSALILLSSIQSPESLPAADYAAWCLHYTHAQYKCYEDINSDTSRSITVKVLDDQGNEVIGVDKVPSLIDVNISVLKTNSIPIELITENKLPDNFTITNIEISPRNIAIKGKKDILGINKINTKPIDINSLLEQTSMEVELDLPEGVELLNPKEKILITYTIEETIVKDYNVLMKDLTIKNLDSTLSINDLDLERSIQIALKGIKSVIDKVTVEDLVVEIDLLGLEEGTHTVQLKVGNIQGVTVDAIKPEPLEIELIKN